MKLTKRGRFVPDKRPLSLSQSLHRHDLSKLTEHDQMYSYLKLFIPLAENLIPLLNMNPHLNNWKFQGVCPLWYNETQAVQAEKQHLARKRKAEKEDAKRLKLEAKRQSQTDKIAMRQQFEPSETSELKHGAGRTIGARPGIYNGVQMRSQLEIRVASELDERKIRWIYEAEALGEAGYLVDFYLPDLAVWIEVKGRMEARDRQVLPQVAHTLKHERQQKLLMYTSSGPCFVVNPSGFREVERKNFWIEVFK